MAANVMDTGIADEREKCTANEADARQGQKTDWCVAVRH